MIVLVATSAPAVTTVPTLKWRAAVVGLKLSGTLPEISAIDLVCWLMPGSPVYLEGLELRPTVEAGVLNTWEDDPAYAKRGEERFLRV